jgi:light-regulated signal transduction histidine kinase (bacteriophytochrome)
VGRTELAIQPVDLNTIVAEVLERIAPVLTEANVSVRIPGALPIVSCDPIRIGEVFFNLITNAIKYNDKDDKWIEIGSQTADISSATSANPDAGQTANGQILFVRDNGIGIREGQESQIFNIFKRLHGRDKYGGGVGAGLTIVKKIIERHNGSIWVRSALGQGTTFYFELESTEQ